MGNTWLSSDLETILAAHSGDARNGEGVVQGWKLVPEIATREMQDAFNAAPFNRNPRKDFDDAYAAMLLAAPAAPAPTVPKCSLGCTVQCKADKAARAEHANALIKIIGARGRRFFYSKKHDRYARMVVDPRGKVWFIDDYRESRIYTHKPGCWNGMGFSHGGTMKSLVEALRDYIARAVPIPRWHVGPERSWSGGNVWGYPAEDMDIVREEAFKLPCMAEKPHPIVTDKQHESQGDQSQ